MGKDHDLLEAARNGNIALVGKLLDQITKRNGPLSSFRRSPSINGQDVNGYTPLHHACLNGHTNVVCLLLAHHATPDVPDIRGSTPLYLAAWAGHQDIVKMLLMHPHKPANPNAQTIENETSLHCAAQHGHNAALAILLAYGADPNIRNNSFQTALDLAAQFGRLQAVQILIRTHSELLEPLRLSSDVSEVKSGCSPPYAATSIKHMFTHTCLHLASRNGHKKVVSTLLAAGVNVNVLTHSGTALHEAALCGKKSVVSILLNAGVHPKATDGNGHTAMDILQDYPPHVTYEIVSVINDFCKHNTNATVPKIVTSPKDTLDEFSTKENSMRDKSHSMPKCVYEKKSKKIELNKPHTKSALDPNPKNTGLSSSMSSLESPKLTESYLKMKPIMWQKSSSDIVGQLIDKAPVYKPVYRQPCIIDLNKQREMNDKQKGTKHRSHKSYEYIYLAKSGTTSGTGGSGSETNSSSTNPSTKTRRKNCVDEYVVMSEPTSCKTSLGSTFSKKPFPSPRTFEGTDYANMNFISPNLNSEKNETSILNASKSYNLRSTDSNNNKEHSPSPGFPPPSVKQAEHMILEFIQPMSIRNKRRSIRFQENDTLENLDSLTIETFDQEDSPESLSSRVSDCVEKFVSDEPFAGLFKGSTLNLAIDENIASEHQTSRLRSPSLVKSIKPIPAKRKVSLRKDAQDEFNESMVWDEINTILESIGNEVANVGNNINPNGVDEKQEKKSEDFQDTFRIRNPADLLLGIPNNHTTNWCHSANTLIYEQILYNVYYLGSTVIRVLHGTASTRKSIQRLKRDETPLVENEFEDGLVKDCSTSTKYLKASNHQTRLKVGIGISHFGVKFIDIETKSTFCIHDIENINCVCQDAEDLRYFAYITKENDMYYCHVFMVDTLELATEIILTLGQAFEVAYQLALNRVKSPIAEENIM